MKVAHYLMAVCKSRQRRQVKVPGGWQGGPPRLVDIMAESTCTSLYYCAPLSHWQAASLFVCLCRPAAGGMETDRRSPAEPRPTPVGSDRPDDKFRPSVPLEMKSTQRAGGCTSACRCLLQPARTGLLIIPPRRFLWFFFFTIIFR